MSKANKLTVEVGALAPKSIFEYGGISWIVLQRIGGGILCLAEKILFNKAFDESNNNNWEDSTLREFLNNEFLEECTLNGAEEAAFIPMTLNLMSDDGLDDYGSTEDLVGLISCEQYRQNRRLIPNANDWWWTITPYSTKANSNSDFVRFVASDGSLSGGNAFHGYDGVRPLCTLKSTILVSSIHTEGDLVANEPEEEQEAVETEETKVFTPQAGLPEAKQAIKDVNNKFLECITKAQERFINNGDIELDAITRAIQTVNAYKDGLPL